MTMRGAVFGVLLLLPALARADDVPAAFPLPRPAGVCALEGDARVPVPVVATAGELVARLPPGAPVCAHVAGQDIELTTLPAVPGPAAPGIAESRWVAEHPVVVERTGTEVHVGRWPLSGVTIDVGEAAVLTQLLELDRMAYPTRRVAVLQVEPARTWDEIAPYIAAFARSGYVSVAVSVSEHGGALAPVPERLTADDALVRTPSESIVSEEGDFTFRFPQSLGIPEIHLESDEIARFDENCHDGACEIVAVTSAGRYLAARTPILPAEDLRRRWIFGHPVAPYHGLPLRQARAPTVVGSLTPLPRHSWATNRVSETDDPIAHLQRLAAEQGNFLIRPCWYREVLKRRYVPFARNPYGTMNLALTVRADGVVTDVEVLESDLRDHRVERCTVVGMREMRFPRATDGKELVFEMLYGFGHG